MARLVLCRAEAGGSKRQLVQRTNPSETLVTSGAHIFSFNLPLVRYHLCCKGSEMDNNVEVTKDSSKGLRIALMIMLCATIFGSGVLRSYQAGVESQARRVMAEVNSPAALAAVQHQIQWAKNIKK
jgi:hypothetical protein